MDNQKVGAISWNEPIKVGKVDRSNEFLRLNDGSNVVRIFTDSYQTSVHRYKTEQDKDKDLGKRIPCSAPTHKVCPLCSDGNKAGLRWLLGVIERTSGTTRILDVGPAVMTQLQKYNKTERYGSPQKYDIDITMDKSAPPASMFLVLPFPPDAMKEEDLKKVREFDLKRLEQLTTSPAPDFVLKLMNTYREKQGLPPKVWSASTATPVSASVEIQGSEFDFPQVDA